MYQMAKTAREKMKAKARSLAAPGTLESGQKTTTATWSPAEALDADVKTGARPVGKGARLYNKGGKVSGVAGKPRADRKARKAGGKVEKEIGIGMANKDVRAANELRDGKKHIGAFKKGGEVKDAGVKDKKALGDIDPSPKRGAAKHYKKGGKVKKADGGFLDNLANALAGRGYIDGSTWIPKEEPVTASDVRAAAEPVRRAAPARRRPAPVKRVVDPQYPYGDSTISGAESPMASGRFMKKGGKAKKADGGSLPSPEEAIGSEARLKGIRVMPGKSSTAAAQVTPAQLRREEGYADADMKASRAGQKRGGRTAKATGGGLFGALKGATKKVGKKGGKTDINIVINAGKTPPRHPAAGMMPPAGPDMMPPPPPPSVGAPPPAALPAGAPPMGAGPGLPPGLPGRKAGGRITKVAKSYKDMEAGAASGEGRLQKTDIESRHTDAPARKAGGRISKVAKSYKDMTAGAGDGEGRLQKTDIAKAKKIRGK